MKKILFIISGSISAYKSLDLLKYLINENFDSNYLLGKLNGEDINLLDYLNSDPAT